MSLYKVGDTVRVVKGVFAKNVGIIADSDNKYHYHVDIRGVRNFVWFHEHYLELVEEEKVDPYAELKLAYREGKRIEVFSETWNTWVGVDRPVWSDPPEQYRIIAEDGGMNKGEMCVISSGKGVGKSVFRDATLKVRTGSSEYDKECKSTFVMNVTKKPTNKEMKMKFETKHYLNGKDITNLENIEIYREIAREESALKALSEVQNKPKRLVAEIESRTAELKAFVAFLDAQDK